MSYQVISSPWRIYVREKNDKLFGLPIYANDIVLTVFFYPTQIEKSNSNFVVQPPGSAPPQNATFLFGPGGGGTNNPLTYPDGKYK